MRTTEAFDELAIQRERVREVSVERVQCGDVCAGEHASLDGAEARVHDRAAHDRAARRARDQDRADAAIAFIGGLTAAADAAIEEVRVTEADAVTASTVRRKLSSVG